MISGKMQSNNKKGHVHMGTLNPKRADYVQAVRRYHAATPIHAHFGIDLTDISPGCVRVRMPSRGEFTQQNGYLQAGVLVSLADAAAGMAAWTLLAEIENLLSVNINVQLMRAADGKGFVAEGRVVRAGSRLMFCEAEVWAEDDPGCKRLIRASMTMAVLTAESQTDHRE